MGTWDTGHFDNDTAADFAADLDEATEAGRTDLVRAALLRAIAAEEYLDSDEAVVAVAAAALVAEQCPGGPPVETVYGPDEPLPRFPEELRVLAVRALDRVTADRSELRDLWAEADGEAGAWQRGTAELRTALAAAISTAASPGISPVPAPAPSVTASSVPTGTITGDGGRSGARDRTRAGDTHGR
ncbi:DUF4259 domain-containing protein [Streptomyces sp. NPDC002018]|uniref:DUF4259 domain-containing protein n=1 Tax=Streptomyces sp. NPDC002018 TaxID=3364629 RepID=UPI0036CD5E31